MTIQDLARTAYQSFETAKRADGEPFTRVKDNAPGWVTDLVHAAHGDFLPDDYRYRWIASVCGAISDDELDEDGLSEWADNSVDVYSGARLAWLASNLQRAGYVDEAMRERGGWTDGEHGRGGGEPLGVLDAIGLGQYAELEETASAVYSFLVERAEDE